jgi:hypothetical protein
MNQKSGAARSSSVQSFTEKQGQYLAFIYTYAHMFRRPPAEADMQRHFQVSPPSVHQMIVTLERNGLIRRQPGVARSIQILVAPKDLPILDWLGINQSYRRRGGVGGDPPRPKQYRGIPRRGIEVSVYGLNPWNSTLTFG